MLKRILFPVDGSGQSVKAWEIAQQIAIAQEAEVVLARVVEFPAWVLYSDESLGASSGDFSLYDDVSKSLIENARTSPAHLATQLQSGSVAVRTTVIEGSAAAALLDVEVSEQVDLVVMATHGRGGLSALPLEASPTESSGRESVRCS